MASIVVHFRVIAYIGSMIYLMIASILKLFDNRKRILIPRPTNPTFISSASTLAHKIRMRYITSEQLVSFYIERLTVINPILNAIVEDRLEQAHAEEKECDEAISNYTVEELETDKPLFGIPITIKESASLKGLSLSGGSCRRIGVKAEEDGGCVARLKAAGAIPLCVTNTPEFCMSMECNNKVIGATNCPFNTLYNSGGSSGGEGALIGAAASICGLGSDIGGSIRIPCAFNSIFGHKFSPDLVPLTNHFPFQQNPRVEHLLTLGPMCRFSEDLPLLSKILTGEKAELLKLDEPVKLSSLKIVFMEDLGNEFGILKVQDEIRSAIRNCVDYMGKTFGSTISDKKFKKMEIAPEFCCASLISIRDSDPYANVNALKELFKSIFGKSDFPYNTLLFLLFRSYPSISSGDISLYKDDIEELKREIIDELGDNGVLIMPSFPTSAIPHKGAFYATIGFVYAAIANVLGLPSTAVPAGINHTGLPIGIQVMAAPNQDRLCFGVAQELENYFGGWKHPF